MRRPYVMYGGWAVILHLIKWAIDAGERFGGPMLFNREMPPVARIVRNVPYGRDRAQRLDVYVPHGSTSDPRARHAVPLLVFIHGGAWIAGDKFAYQRVCRTFAAAGFLTISANYRVWPHAVFPKPSQDAAAAVRWAHEHAGEFGGDPSRPARRSPGEGGMFLAGDSAGAHLVLSYAAGLRKPELFEATGVTRVIPAEALRGLILFYGVYDCEHLVGSRRFTSESSARQLLGSDGATYRKRLRVVSPIHHLSASLPPCFICAGELDFLYNDSVALARELERLGVPHRALFLSAREHPMAFHAFLNFYRRGCSKLALREAIAFAKGTP